MKTRVRHLPLGSLVQAQTAKAFGEKDSARPYIGLEHLAQGQPVLLGSAPSSESISVNSVFEIGDILFGKLRPNLRKCAAAPFPGYCSTDILVLRSREDVDPDFAACVLQSEAVFAAAVESAVGTKMPRTNWDALASTSVFAPADRDEQRTIALVLKGIDRAIEQTEALLAKQQRIKTGLMHDLLTRGLDAQGHLRDPSTHRFKKSPLGSVPADWSGTNIGNLATLVTSGPRGWARYYSNAGAKFIRIGNLTREHVNFRLQDMQFVSPPEGAEGNRTQLMQGDVLFSITADLGVIGLVPADFGPAYINQHIALIRPNTGDVVPGWLANFLASHWIQKWISNINESGAKAGLNLPTINGVPITVPKLPEQQMIAEILALCDRQIAEIYSRIAKLRRLKTGLMHDLLTGRVAVTPLLAEAGSGNH